MMSENGGASAPVLSDVSNASTMAASSGGGAAMPADVLKAHQAPASPAHHYVPPYPLEYLQLLHEVWVTHPSATYAQATDALKEAILKQNPQAVHFPSIYTVATWSKQMGEHTTATYRLDTDIVNTPEAIALRQQWVAQWSQYYTTSPPAEIVFVDQMMWAVHPHNCDAVISPHVPLDDDEAAGLEQPHPHPRHEHLVCYQMH